MGLDSITSSVGSAVSSVFKPTSNFFQGAQIGGSLLGAYGAYQSSDANQAAYQAQSQAASDNAVYAIMQANDAISRGETALSEARAKNRQLKGAQRAAMASNGVDLNVGTPRMLTDQTEYFGNLDENAIINNANREAWGYQTQANNFLRNASSLNQRANIENPWLSAGTSLLTSATKVAPSWYRYGQAGGGSNNTPWYSTHQATGLPRTDYEADLYY